VYVLIRRWHLSLFEKVIVVNSIMLIGEALAGLWITSHSLEVHHYLIDTSFIILATLLTFMINFVLLRASFSPLFHLLSTIREISSGKTHARAKTYSSDVELSELALAFNTMLDHLEDARHEQTNLILQAQEEAQRRIALELHDEVGQNMTALLIHVEVLKQTIQTFSSSTRKSETQQQLAEELEQLTRLTQITTESIRVIAQQLRPSVLDDLGLLPAFRWLVEDSRQRLHLNVTLTIRGFTGVSTLPAQYETTLFRITQESLTNVARHTHAKYVTILLAQEGQHIELSIQDLLYPTTDQKEREKPLPPLVPLDAADSSRTMSRGSGLLQYPTTDRGNEENLTSSPASPDVDNCSRTTPNRSRGLALGILGMRERARLLGGTLTIHSRPNYGTTVQAIIPYHETQNMQEISSQGSGPIAQGIKKYGNTEQ
jgi:two-component system, NarL family, sensor histidine kinase UhpB